MQGLLSAEMLAKDSRLERVTGAILAQSVQYSAADAFDAQARLKELAGAARVEMAKVRLLTFCTLKAVL